MDDTKVLDELTDEEVKSLIGRARKMLADEKSEQATPVDPDLEKKDPTSVTAVDQTKAVERDAPARFGAPTILHDETKRSLEDFRLGALVKGLAGLGWQGAGLEKAWAQKAALEVDGDSAGGFITLPETTVQQIMPMLKAKAVFRKAGATILPNAGLVTRLPTQTGATTAYWVGMGAQSSAVTESEPTYGQKQLVLKRCAARSLIDIDLLRHSFASVEALVRKDIVEQLALKEDNACWEGTGGTEISGIRWDAGLTNTHSSITELNLMTHVKGALDTMAARNAADGITAMLMHPTTYGYVTNKVDGIDRALMFSNYTEKHIGKQVFGIPVHTSTQVDSGYILIGNFSEYFIAEGGGIEIKVLNEKYYDQLAIGIVAVHRVDGVARQISEFELLSGITS